jgi:hypothetical protein
MVVGQKRVDVKFDDLRNVGDQMRHLDQRAADRGKVRREAVAVTGEQFGYACARDELAREHRIERGQTNRAVGHDFHCRASLAEENNRAEHHIRRRTDDKFLGGGPTRHGLHREAEHACVGPVLLQPFQHGLRGVIDRLRIL